MQNFPTLIDSPNASNKRVRRPFYLPNTVDSFNTLIKWNFGLSREDCQQAMTDEFLCIVAGCVLGTDVCHLMFKTKSTWFKVKKIPPLSSRVEFDL